jgi:hypothetical protein
MLRTTILISFVPFGQSDFVGKPDRACGADSLTIATVGTMLLIEDDYPPLGVEAQRLRGAGSQTVPTQVTNLPINFGHHFFGHRLSFL